MNNKIKKTFSYLVLFTIFMFSFSYMLVPLYDVFCEITGLNGKTGRTSSELVIENPLERNIEVTFTSSVANLGPFNFKPNQKELVVKPGKIYTAFYTLTNLSDTDLIATASPSVVPGKYAEYFKKIECFCFQHQEIKANQTKKLVIQFIVDDKLPSEASSLVLAYTMFNITEKQISYNLEKINNE
mgnify:FL=1